MSAMGAVVGAMIGVSVGASAQESKLVDPMTAFGALSDSLQADYMKSVMSMPFLGAVAGGYAGYRGMIPYVRDYV